MNLTGYSDSEDSGDDAPTVTQATARPTPKVAFQKVVDRSNPGKIKLNLPSASQSHTEKDDIDSEARPAKKARIGGSAFGGFNAMLPAPKKPKVEAMTADAPSGKRGLGKGLGAGVNLKTGSEPAFQRQRTLALDEYDENGNPVKQEARKQEDFRALLNLPTPKAETKAAETPVATPTATPAPSEPVAQEPTRPRFMPKGMGWGKKKKPSAARPAAAPTQSDVGSMSQSSISAHKTEQKPPPKPKVSLFGSVSQEIDAPAKQTTGEYQPLIYGAKEDEETPMPDSVFQSHQQAIPNAPHPSNNLTNIASELNLTEAERRQLFGRKGQGPDLSGAKIVDFNTDQEYAHNEKLRQQGETIQHNALKSISGTGKNSLRSLINVASTQKDALEEHFASGRRNKKEAGNKYGW
ncbi:uncharacterized protein N0V89_003659 [Didymosphaeria variabile]|uniref:Mitotic checkpoint regulator, MAD2B-interacting-domain-containing protein n=1 Tax=Didymosphaeria variabile TaxID=1932322 RepID=A0A9W8XNG1_9PLEO|nr:uncharacterized protein N0V89_003659 [Didymosphaeria variabile]KAJ4355639.1 hypothetical protein N0V89_003659 [Didymosphaeria variabile]